MNEEKIELINEYLRQHLRSRNVEHKRDFDLKAEAFKIYVADEILLLKVSDELLNDNELAGIATMFVQWNVANLLQANANRTLLLTNTGPKLLV